MNGSDLVVRRSLRWLVVLTCAIVILAASVQKPGSGPSPTLFGVALSIYLHLLAYGGLTVVVGYALLSTDRRALFLAGSAAVCFGVGVELVQAPLPYRTASVLDVAVNAAGAAVGAVLWRTVAPAFDAATGVADDGTTAL